MDNHMLAPGDGNISSKSEDNDSAHTNNLWGLGESSYCEQLRDASYVGSQVSERSQNMENNSSSSASLNLSSNDMDVWEKDCQSGVEVGLCHTPNNSIHFSTEQIPSSNAYSSGNIGTSSENYDPSLGTLGLSGKSKALEGTFGQFYPGGSSSSKQPMENIMPHGSLSILSCPLSVSSTNHMEQLNSRGKVGKSGHRDSVTFDASGGSSIGHSSVNAAQSQSETILSSNGKNLMSPIDLENTSLKRDALLCPRARDEAFIEQLECRDSLTENGLQAEAEAMMHSTIILPERRNITERKYRWSVTAEPKPCSSIAWWRHKIAQERQEEAENSSLAERRAALRRFWEATTILVRDIENAKRMGRDEPQLSEEKILGAMNRQKYAAVGASTNMEPCCICQEEYVAGDDVGKLDCGHEYHTNCIKKWLMKKNICPFCRMKALKT